jgi:hypothetical protein
MNTKVSTPNDLKSVQVESNINNTIDQIEARLKNLYKGSKFYDFYIQSTVNPEEARLVEQEYTKAGWKKAKIEGDRVTLWTVMDVHTQHCDRLTCKYGEEEVCTVVSGGVPPTASNNYFE